MIKQESKITPRQLMFFLIQTQVGVGFLSLPYQVQLIAKGGGWISIICAGLLAQFLIWLVWALCRKYPSENAYQFFPKLLGKPLGNLLSFIYIAYFLFVVVINLVKINIVIGKWVLAETPRWVLFILMIILVMYLVKEKLRIIARFHVLATVIILVMVVFSLLGYTNVDITYLFPITEAGWKNILIAGYHSFFSMIGASIILVIYPMVEGDSITKLKALSKGNLITTLFYTFEVFTCLIIFSPLEFPLVPEPIIYMLKAYSFHIIDRIDIIFLSLWLVLSYTTMVSYAYLASVGLGHFFHRGEHKKSIYYSAAIIFLIALIPSGMFDPKTYGEFLETTYTILFLCVPIFLNIIALFIKRKKETAI